MGEMTKVRVDIYVPGQGYEAHEFQYCPIIFAKDRYGSEQCPIGGGICNFGLTEVEPPATCPIRIGNVRMKFSIVKD